MSLRTRLIAGLLILTAAGMLLAGAITYAEQRSFLQERVDQQANAALGPVSHALDARGINVPGYEHDGRDQPGDGGGPRGGSGGARPPGDQPTDLPPGTYGQRRDASGKVLGSAVLSYGQASLPAPRIPSDLKLNQLVTVGSKGSGVRYRVLAQRSMDQPGTTVVAIPMQSVDQTLHRLLLVEGLVIAGVLVALAVAASLLVRLGLRPLDRIGRTAGAIASGDLSRRVTPTGPRTEVGRLGTALNAMLERLEGAFAEREASEDRLRRFIADASHELRTPLASIRGYAELHRLGSAGDPRDTARAMRRIEEEAARMGVLVEDLLTLARLDELPDAVAQEVDLTRLAGDAVDDARAVDPGRPIELHACGDGSPVVVVGDPHQLRQVLGNLLRNAMVHTPSATPVEVQVSRSDGNVEVTVRDHGPGLPTDDADALFERFWRAEPGRGRGRAGAGLGLAIVARIVEAHRGSVSAGNDPDGGARFTVTLPAVAAAPEAPRSPAPATA